MLLLIPIEVLPALIGGLIAGSITMLGWFAADVLKRIDARRNRYADYVQKQIYEFYAPLSTLAQEEAAYRQTQALVL